MARETRSDGRYRHARWLRMRARQLAQQPLCEYCLQGLCSAHAKVKDRELDGRRAECLTQATVVDHRIPHRGVAKLFWDASNLQSLCAHCHSGHKQREESGKDIPIGTDGWPA